MWLHVCVSGRETFRGSWYRSDCLEDFFWFLRKVSMTIWREGERRRGKSLTPTGDKRFQSLYAFWFPLLCLMFTPPPPGSCEYVWNVQSSGLSRSVQSAVGSRTHPPQPQWVMRQWFVGVCEAGLICKGKRGRVLNQEQAGALSPRSTKQLCRLRSQLRQVEYGLIKDRRNGNFTQFLQIRGYCFTNSWGFC